VYVTALTELARYLPRNEHRNRFLRQGIRPIDSENGALDMPGASFDLPPGASFDIEPHAGNDHV
jgi:putative (di)nucleoside polyphosphate hydrolase